MQFYSKHDLEDFMNSSMENRIVLGMGIFAALILIFAAGCGGKKESKAKRPVAYFNVIRDPRLQGTFVTECQSTKMILPEIQNLKKVQSQKVELNFRGAQFSQRTIYFEDDSCQNAFMETLHAGGFAVAK